LINSEKKEKPKNKKQDGWNQHISANQQVLSLNQNASIYKLI
jgi:hypothetical protein